MIVAAREAGGPFTSLHDFCDRVDMRQLNKRTLEALIKAGAFDSTGYTRKHLHVDDGRLRRRRQPSASGTATTARSRCSTWSTPTDHGFADERRRRPTATSGTRR